MTVTDAELARLEAAVERALETDDLSSVTVLGYGEISTVLALDTAGGRYAVKRLPRFASQEALDAYGAVLQEYVAALDRAGIRVVPTSLRSLARADGSLTAYCVQPALAPASLAPRWLERASDADGARLLGVIVDRIAGAVSPRVGLDGQLSNWVTNGGDEPSYLDVSTPLLRDPGGRERLDMGLFIASLPWALRGAARRFLLQGIIDKYYAARGVLLDLAGNLVKEGQGRFIEPLLERANRFVAPALTADEAHRYYASDAKSWALLQRLRRADRAWQRHVRGRSYGYLLPGKIERRT